MLPTLSPEFENFPHQLSSVHHFFSVLGTLENTISNVLISFPRNDITNHIQKDSEILPINFPSLLDQFNWLENPVISQLLVAASFVQ